MDRMNREQFFAATAGLGRSPDPRPRIRIAAPAVDPDAVLDGVREFIALAR